MKHIMDLIRKAIDYLCHLAVVPEYYSQTVDVNRELFLQSISGKLLG